MSFDDDTAAELGWTFSTPAWELAPRTPEQQAIATLKAACAEIDAARGYDIDYPFG
jgi:hypothetical protein